MPDAAPASLPLDQALDEGLRLLFGQLQVEPVPDALLRLMDRLEEACDETRVDGERRAIA